MAPGRNKTSTGGAGVKDGKKKKPKQNKTDGTEKKKKKDGPEKKKKQKRAAPFAEDEDDITRFPWTAREQDIFLDVFEECFAEYQEQDKSIMGASVYQLIARDMKGKGVPRRSPDFYKARWKMLYNRYTVIRDKKVNPTGFGVTYGGDVQRQLYERIHEIVKRSPSLYPEANSYIVDADVGRLMGQKLNDNDPKFDPSIRLDGPRANVADSSTNGKGGGTLPGKFYRSTGPRVKTHYKNPFDCSRNKDGFITTEGEEKQVPMRNTPACRTGNRNLKNCDVIVMPASAFDAGRSPVSSTPVICVISKKTNNNIIEVIRLDGSKWPKLYASENWGFYKDVGFLSGKDRLGNVLRPGTPVRITDRVILEELGISNPSAIKSMTTVCCSVPYVFVKKTDNRGSSLLVVARKYIVRKTTSVASSTGSMDSTELQTTAPDQYPISMEKLSPAMAAEQARISRLQQQLLQKAEGSYFDLTSNRRQRATSLTPPSQPRGINTHRDVFGRATEERSSAHSNRSSFASPSVRSFASTNSTVSHGSGRSPIFGPTVEPVKKRMRNVVSNDISSSTQSPPDATEDRFETSSGNVKEGDDGKKSNEQGIRPSTVPLSNVGEALSPMHDTCTTIGDSLSDFDAPGEMQSKTSDKESSKERGPKLGTYSSEPCPSTNPPNKARATVHPQSVSGEERQEEVPSPNSSLEECESTEPEDAVGESDAADYYNSEDEVEDDAQTDPAAGIVCAAVDGKRNFVGFVIAISGKIRNQQRLTLIDVDQEIREFAPSMRNNMRTYSDQGAALDMNQEELETHDHVSFENGTGEIMCCYDNYLLLNLKPNSRTKKYHVISADAVRGVEREAEIQEEELQNERRKYRESKEKERKEDEGENVGAEEPHQKTSSGSKPQEEQRSTQNDANFDFEADEGDASPGAGKYWRGSKERSNAKNNYGQRAKSAMLDELLETVLEAQETESEQLKSMVGLFEQQEDRQAVLDGQLNDLYALQREKLSLELEELREAARNRQRRQQQGD